MSWMGTDNQDPVIGVDVINPNLDAVSEMNVISQNYQAEFGQAVGGLVVAQTKSGSNSIHGSAFYFRRSDAQQARDPFTQFAPDPVTGKFIPSFMFNQFGGSVGGPIKHDKLFFFGDYQGQREKSGLSLVTTVPTALAESTCTGGTSTGCNLSDYQTPRSKADRSIRPSIRKQIRAPRAAELRLPETSSPPPGSPRRRSI